ncbi:MAG: hypothetical protein EXX96DRAFT_550910 [Benjaminiella poitrasii]|nr:MAG: hypothetical protein EXX96DRAFT_550910 [Benjaminiella poitrasii]
MSIEHANKLEKVLKEITCTICQGIFEDPHSLNCGHCYCGQCIFEWLKNNKSCPMCRVPTIRQPIHILTLQELSNLFRAENAIPSTRLTRADWIQLYPIDNQADCIRDEDEDGVIYRCSQCGWELDEENFCSHCLVTFNVNRRHEIELSDIESYRHSDDEENLSDFVVNDDYPMDYSDDSHVFPDEYISGEEDHPEPVEISDDEDEIRFGSNNRKRRIELISDDDDNESDSDNDSDNKSVISISEEENDSHEEDHFDGYRRNMLATEDEEEEEEEEEEESDNSYRRSAVSRFIDDYADEDDEEEEEVKEKPEKIDKITENIIRAKNNMASNHSINPSKESSDSSEDDSDESDVPDYQNLLNPLTEAGNNEAGNNEVESDEAESNGPSQSISSVDNSHSKKNSKKKKDKNKHQSFKKNKKGKEKSIKKAKKFKQ